MNNGNGVHLHGPLNDLCMIPQRYSLPAFISFIVKSLVLCAIPTSMFWFPLLEKETVGILTLGDLSFICLWLLTVPSYLLSEHVSRQQRIAFSIHLMAVTPGVFAVVGSALFSGSGQPANEMLFHLKRFGFASVMPLAMVQCGLQRFLQGIRYMLMLCIAVQVFALLAPEIRDALPVFAQMAGAEIKVSRALGLFTNPNDLAYFTVCTMANLLAIRANTRRASPIGTIYFVLTLCGAGYLLIESASRSAVIALLAAYIYYFSKGHAGIKKKAFIGGALVLAGAFALNYSDVFLERMSDAYLHGTKELNLVGRLEAQKIAALAALENPLGVGFRNFPEATHALSQSAYFLEVSGSDSIYVDFLLGAGFLGFLALIACFALCWRFIRSTAPGQDQPAIILRSGCLAAFIFGLATIAPASVFVAPSFFFLVGSAALVSTQPRSLSLEAHA